MKIDLTFTNGLKFGCGFALAQLIAGMLLLFASLLVFAYLGGVLTAWVVETITQSQPTLQPFLVPTVAVPELPTFQAPAFPTIEIPAFPTIEAPATTTFSGTVVPTIGGPFPIPTPSGWLTPTP